jgi:AraC-like DNA-binding protein
MKRDLRPLPLTHPADQRVFPTHVLVAVAAALCSEGVDVKPVLRAGGIDTAELANPALRVSERQWLSVFEAALAHSSDPAIGFQVGSRLNVAGCGLYGYAMLSSQTHADVIAFATKYNRMISPFAAMRFVLEQNRAGWLIEPTLKADSSDRLYQFALEVKLMAMLAVMRDLYGRDFGLSAIRVVQAAPEHAAEYARWLQCPVHFGAEFNELWFDAGRLGQSMPYANALTHSTIRDLCEKVLLRIPQVEGLAGLVQARLVERPGCFPDLDAMANELGMSSRTLRRRLQVEGKSYREIVNEVRKRLAISYLRTTDLTSEEIASRLGYTEPASFRHAFGRWMQVSPSDYRARFARQTP